ncbi:MAG: 30S ribosomal protein S18 [Patescibacteria group bacterium]
MQCYFCQHNLKDIDYKNVSLLRRFIASSAKIKSRVKTGACAKHQRKIKTAIKRARSLGLVPTSRA